MRSLERYEEDEEILTEWAGFIRDRHGDDSQALTGPLVALGNAALRSGKYAQALERYMEVYKHPGNNEEGSIEVWESAFKIGQVHLGLGRFAEAEPFAAEALDVAEEYFPTADIIDESALSLGIIRQSRGKHAEALPSLERALELYRPGTDHAVARCQIGYNLVKLGRNDEAGPVFLECHVELESTRPRKMQLEGKLEEAASTLERGLANRNGATAPDYVQKAFVRNALALVRLDQERFEEAEEHSRRAITIFEITVDKENPNVAMALHTLAAVLAAQGRYGEAREPLERALRIRETFLPEGHPWLEETRALHVEVMQALKLHS